MAKFNLLKAARLIEAGRAGDVVEDLKARTRKMPLDQGARYLLAHAYETLARRREAEQAWKKASEAAPAKEAASPPRGLAAELTLTDALRSSLELILASGPAGEEESDDLQRLIADLHSRRTVPAQDADVAAGPDLDDDVDGMVSETLARIYASQKQFREAARAYRQLSRTHPDEAERFGRLADGMLARADSE